MYSRSSASTARDWLAATEDLGSCLSRRLSSISMCLAPLTLIFRLALIVVLSRR